MNSGYFQFPLKQEDSLSDRLSNDVHMACSGYLKEVERTEEGASLLIGKICTCWCSGTAWDLEDPHAVTSVTEGRDRSISGGWVLKACHSVSYFLGSQILKYRPRPERLFSLLGRPHRCMDKNSGTLNLLGARRRQLEEFDGKWNPD
ncbi:hypothetical protein FXO38_12692 [Capsicum annuum]|nr:hypothetical protein FXO38_12692 [Capsicum annuum]